MKVNQPGILFFVVIALSSCNTEKNVHTQNVHTKEAAIYNFESIQIEPGELKTSRRGVYLRTIMLQINNEHILPTLNSYRVQPDGPDAYQVEKFVDTGDIEGNCSLAPMSPWIGYNGHVNVTFDSIKPGDSIVVKVLDKGDCSGSEYNLYAIDNEGEKHLICSSNKSEVCTVPF